MTNYKIIKCSNNKDSSFENIDGKNKTNIDILNVFNNLKREIVLCVGAVQSGKTRKIFECIKYALEKLDYDICILFGGTTKLLYNQTQNRLEINELNKIAKIYNRLNNNISTKKISPNQKTIINILKSNKDLEDILYFLRLNNAYNKKVLLIDDEADYASINISKDGNQSQTFKNILKLFNQLNNGKLLQVTATPFANIISSSINNLIPDRIVCWNRYDDYKGLIEFNNNAKENYHIIKSHKDEEEKYRMDIKECIEYFFKTCAINYDYLINLNNEITCLINIDIDTNTHKKIENMIYKIFDEYKNEKLINYNDDIDIKKHFKTFKEYSDVINKIYENLDLIVLNSKEDNSIKVSKKFNIYCGGTMLSRGNTFENLICELILNVSKNKISVDTLLQKCRWFGNRKHIMSLMKIFMSQEIYDSLFEAQTYVDLLTPGIHDFNELKIEIKKLDNLNSYVISTMKG